MTACASSNRPALIRVATLLDALVRRTRSPAEHGVHMRLQADAEGALLRLLTSLGELDELPLRMAIEQCSSAEESNQK